MRRDPTFLGHVDAWRQVNNDGETAAETLRDARQVLADLIRAQALLGSKGELAEAHRVLEAKIKTFEAGLKAWDNRASARVDG